MKSQRRVGYRWQFTYECDNCRAQGKTFNQLDRAGFSQFSAMFPQAVAAGIELPEHLCPDCAELALEGALTALSTRAEARDAPAKPLEPPRTGPKSLDLPAPATRPEPPRTGPKSLDEPPTGPVGPRT